MQKKKARGVYALLLVAVLVAASLGTLWSVSAAGGEAIFVALNDSKDIAITENVTASFTADTGKGTMLASYNENSMIEINRAFEGDFEIALRFNPFTKGTGAMETRHIDFKVLDIFFIDCADESNYFSVTVAGDSYWGSNYLKAMAVHKDFKGGVNQDMGNAVIAPGTTVNGSFEASSPYDARTYIAFDASTNRVLGSTFSDGSNPNMTVIADLDDPAHVKENVFGGFKGAYKVRIRMSGLIEPTNRERPARLVVYSLNGQDVATSAPDNNIGPNSFTTFTSKAVVGQAYPLPKAYTYDVLSGKAEFAAGARNTITITDPDRHDTVLAANAATFTPTMRGAYTVIYTAADADGTAGKPKSYTVEALDTAPEIAVTVQGKNRATVAKDKTFTLAAATASSALSLCALGAVDCFVTVKQGAKTVLAETPSVPTPIAFTEYGAYTVVYTGRDYLGNTATVEQTIECRNEPNVTHGELAGEVYMGETFDVPSASATYNGQSIPVTVRIVDPYNKVVTLTESTYTPAVNGRYTLQYVCAYGEGQSVVETIDVSVGVKPANMFINVKNTQIESNVQAPIYSMPASGVRIVGTGDGATAKFTNVIDVRDVTKESPFLEFQVTPTLPGKEEFKKLTVFMTDVADPDSKITLEFITSQWDNRWAYVKAAADKNRLLGIWQDGVPDANGDFPILDNFNGGTQLRNSFAGVPYMDVKTKLFRVYYDNAEKALYAEDHLGIKQMIIDLDDPTKVGGGKEWKGFTSGQIEVGFRFNETVETSASILVVSVAGQRLGGSAVVDETPPVIATNALDPAPKALVGTKYRLPDPAGYDVIDGLIADVKVICTNEQGHTVDVAEDNSIVPTVRGRYTVTYRCSDRSGNEAIATFEFDAFNALDEIAIAYEKPLADSALVGETVYLPSVTAEGGSYIIKVSRYLIFEGSVLPIAADSTFVPLKEGAYRLMHLVEDYIGTQREFNDEIVVTRSNTPIGRFPTLQSVLIDGATYVLPEFEPIDYYGTDGGAGQKVKARITVQYGAGDPVTLGDDRVFTPHVENSGDTVTIVYTAVGSAGNAVKQYPITVIKPIGAEDYFIKSNVTATPYDEALGFTATDDFAEFRFINPVPSKYIEVSFGVTKAGNHFDYLDVWFIDGADGENKFFVRVWKRTDLNGKGEPYTTSYAQINGRGRKIEIPGSFYENSNALLKIDYDSLTGTVYAYAGSEIGTVTENYDGMAIKPFSKTAYVSLAFGEIDGDPEKVAEVRLLKIMNQSFFGRTGEAFSDTTPPILAIGGQYAKAARLGEQITLYSATAMDVISPQVTVTVQVQAPDRSFPVQKTSATVDRLLTLEQYGNYRITYEAIDGNGRRYVQTILIKVEDVTPPEVTVGDMNACYTVGKEIALPTITVTDLSDSTPDLHIFVRTPYGNLVAVTDGKFTPSALGKHKLIVFALDDDYSYVICEKEFWAIGG